MGIRPWKRLFETLPYRVFRRKASNGKIDLQRLGFHRQVILIDRNCALFVGEIWDEGITYCRAIGEPRVPKYRLTETLFSRIVIVFKKAFSRGQILGITGT